MLDPSDSAAIIAKHSDVEIERFSPRSYCGEVWTFEHLEPFGMRAKLSDDLEVDVVVFFSCHCFRHPPQPARASSRRGGVWDLS